MGEFKNVLKQLRQSSNMTQEELAKKLKIAKSTVSMYENGNREPDRETMEAIADFFNVDMNYLYGRTTQTTRLSSLKPSGVSIPIVSTIVAGMPADAYEDPLGYEEISHELAKTGDFICLKVKGDSMSPVIQDGDLVIIRQQNDVESGDIAVVRINGDEATLKKVHKSEDGITLIAYNPAVYEPHFYSNKEIEELPVEVDGKVVEMKRMF